MTGQSYPPVSRIRAGIPSAHLRASQQHDREVAAKAVRDFGHEQFGYAWTDADGRHVPAEFQAAYVAGASDAHEVVSRLAAARAADIEAGEVDL